MALGIGRRKFIAAALGGAAVASPFAAHAQQLAKPVVGFLCSGSPDKIAQLLAGFRQGLADAGYFEGRNVAIEYRWAEDHLDRLPEMAADLANRNVTVIAAMGGPKPALAAKAATSTIPIVFTMASDPVHWGLVASLDRPGGNATGIAIISSALEGKRIGVLYQLMPHASSFAALINPSNVAAETQEKEVEAAGEAIGRSIHIFRASSIDEIEVAFAQARQVADGLVVTADIVYVNQREPIASLAAKYRLPTIYEYREFPMAGGLMSYGPDQPAAWRQAGVYTGRILKGEKAADLPVMQSTKFELVINLKTAKALGIEVPPDVLAIADDVIE